MDQGRCSGLLAGAFAVDPYRGTVYISASSRRQGVGACRRPPASTPAMRSGTNPNPSADPLLPRMSETTPVRGTIRRVAKWLVVPLWLGGCAPTQMPPSPPHVEAAPATPTFTTDQADRGESIFGSHCGSCHGTSEFSGQLFRYTWMSRSLGDLFDFIRTAMPQDAPGSLEANAYADVLAFFLRLNGRVPGERELPADATVLGTVGW